MPPPDDNAQCFVHMVRIENFETRIDKSFNHYPLTINFSYLLLAQKAWFFSIFSFSSLLLWGHGHNKSCRVCECPGPSNFIRKNAWTVVQVNISEGEVTAAKSTGDSQITMKKQLQVPLMNYIEDLRFNWMSSDLERQSMTYIYAHNARERNEKEEGLGIFICSF